MKTRVIIFAAVSALLLFSLPSFSQVKGNQAISLKWSVIEDCGYTIKGYPVSNMMDGNPATTWAGCLDYVEEDGTKIFDDSLVYGDIPLGFKIKVQGSKVRYLTITAGYAKSSTAFRNNSAPTSIAIYDGRCRINDGGEFIDKDGNQAEPVVVKDLVRSMGSQIVDLGAGIDTDTLWLIILDIDRGTKYNDLCISEIAFYGQRQ